jgi:3-deoxy-D-manno-octulosonic-acid transferase
MFWMLLISCDNINWSNLGNSATRRIKPIIFGILTHIYSLFIWLVAFPIAKFVGFFNRSVGHQLHGRNFTESSLAALSQKIDPSVPTHLYLCSSAGEYEQAKPVFVGIEQRMRCNTVICFVSKSGMRFAKSNNETRPFFLAPLDTVRNWQRINHVLKPSLVVVIRYEVWPAFAYVFSKSSTLSLVNLSRSKRPQTDFYYRQAVQRFSSLCCVSEADVKYFRETLGERGLRLVYTGDSKFDRVLQRKAEHSSPAMDTVHLIEQLIRDRFVITVGSAWVEDINFFAPAYARFSQLAERKSAALIVAHDISARSIEAIRDRLTHEGMKCIRLSELMRGTAPWDRTNLPGHFCLIVDSIGFLFELYRLSSAAMVGGAMHFKVHNVLEPACFNLPICFGPYYTSQNEAILMVERGFASVVQGTKDIFDWLQRVADSQDTARPTLDFVESLAGATKRITDHLLTIRQ